MAAGCGPRHDQPRWWSLTPGSCRCQFASIIITIGLPTYHHLRQVQSAHLQEYRVRYYLGLTPRAEVVCYGGFHLTSDCVTGNPKGQSSDESASEPVTRSVRTRASHQTNQHQSQSPDQLAPGPVTKPVSTRTSHQTSQLTVQAQVFSVNHLLLSSPQYVWHPRPTS